ncbi:hypothetical protein SLE2022_076110 [Rubroshorea leprosula]
MVSLAKIHCRYQPLLNLSPKRHCPLFPKPLSSVSFRSTVRPFSSSPPFKLRSIRASYYRSNDPLETIAPIFRTTCTVAVAAATIFFMWLKINHKTVIIAPAPAAAIESASKQLTLEEQETTLESDYLTRYPDNFKVLWSLMEVKVKLGKFQEATDVINSMIVCQPRAIELKVLKAQIYCLIGEQELAKKEFMAALVEAPYRKETKDAMIVAYLESGQEWKDLKMMISKAMGICNRAKQLKESREWKELIAWIRIICRVIIEILSIIAESSEDKD